MYEFYVLGLLNVECCMDVNYKLLKIIQSRSRSEIKTRPEIHNPPKEDSNHDMRYVDANQHVSPLFTTFPHRVQATLLSRRHKPMPRGNQNIAARIPTNPNLLSVIC